MLEHIVPQSIVDAAARNEVLQIVFFAIIFAVALTRVEGRAKTVMLSFCESLAEVMFKFTGLVMMFAPVGIGAAIAVTVGQSGIGVLKNLGLLVLTLYGALIVFALVVLLPVALIARCRSGEFLRTVKEPWLIAFSTASSEAALPLALQNMERSGCRSGSSRSCCRPATPSTSTDRRCTWRWRRCSWPRRRASTCRCRSSC